MGNRIIIDSYRNWKSCLPLRTKVREMARDSVIFMLAQPRRIDKTTGWIRFPYYHHVFDDERKGFSRQLDYLRNFGQFISLDEAVKMIVSGEPIDGRYFCITFDDGIKCCYDNVLPILAEKQIIAAFFIVVDFTTDTDAGQARVCRALHSRVSYKYEYLTWAECRKMADAGMIIGSHTRSHVKLSDLTERRVRDEMLGSKQTVERKLGRLCNHFACPWGQPEKDFRLGIDEKIAKDVGFKSFLTTRRGPVYPNHSTYLINRDNTLANWGNYQLRYFLSL